MKRKIGLLAAGFIMGLGTTAVVAATPDAGEVCVDVPEFGVEVCGTTTTSTTTTLPPTTTTTLPPTTTTLPPTTTTVPPTTTTLPPFEADACVLDQIEREPTKATGGPKVAFDIMMSRASAGEPWWTAAYKTNLGNGYGWISGDRHGYAGAYMFLVELDTGRVVARVYFARVTGAAYAFINDRYMDEIQTTHLGFDGTCVPAGPGNQAEGPGAAEAYEPNFDPDERPIIRFVDSDGQVIEDRSYTNTVILTPVIKFRDGGKTGPLTVVNGNGEDPHTVYQRQIVLMDSLSDGSAPAVVVYYDTLVPDVTIEG